MRRGGDGAAAGRAPTPAGTGTDQSMPWANRKKRFGS